MSLSPHVIYLWPVSWIIVMIIAIVSRAIIVVATIRWEVTPVVVPEVVIIIVSTSVKISGRVIAPCVPLVIVRVVYRWLIISLLIR